MGDGNISVTVDRNPQTPEKASLLEARQNNEKMAQDLDAVRNKARDSLSNTPVAGQDARNNERAELPEEPEENLESIDVELPNGMIVNFGPPSDISLTMRIIRLIGDQAAEALTNRVYRILLSVRSVDGVPVTPITNTIEADKLANRLGDAGLDVLSIVMLTYWKAARAKDLKILKKNQRK